MSEKAVAVRERDALAELGLTPADLMPAGLDNLQPGDVGMPPRVRISQPNRPIEIADGGEAPAGSIVNTLTGEVYESLEIAVIVFLNDTRVMWPDGFDVNNDPICASDDGVMPSQSSDMRTLTAPKPGPCAECESAQFVDGVPPTCKRQRNFVFWLLDQGEAAIYTAQSTALKPVKTLTSLTKMQGLRKSILMTTQRVKDDRGTWYVPMFTKGRALDASEIKLLVEAKREMDNLTARADLDEADAGGVDAPVQTTTEEDAADEIPF